MATHDDDDHDDDRRRPLELALIIHLLVDDVASRCAAVAATWPVPLAAAGARPNGGGRCTQPARPSAQRAPPGSNSRASGRSQVDGDARRRRTIATDDDEDRRRRGTTAAGGDGQRRTTTTTTTTTTDDDGRRRRRRRRRSYASLMQHCSVLGWHSCYILCVTCWLNRINQVAYAIPPTPSRNESFDVLGSFGAS